jgi:hypothetical protein
MGQKLSTIILLMSLHLTMRGQDIPIEQYQNLFQVHIQASGSSIKVDGILDDSIWQKVEPVKNFFLKYPTDRGRPHKSTEVRMTYDEKFIYIGFTCFDSGKSIVQSLKRDIGHLDNDGVGISLDPFNQHTTGFIFVVNAFNAQSEDQLSLNQDNDLTWSWNNKWFSATHRYADRWTAEMAIPFKTLRYPSAGRNWGLNFMRVDMGSNEYSAWTRVPVNFRIYNLGYTGSLIWDKPPPDPGKNMVLIPFVTGGFQQDAENHSGLSGTGNLGMDSKITLTSSLNLDLTVNPDFSQVEVDQQVTNLTRYDIFLPEKRSFFLENSDIFGEFGIPGLITPFYSRRIGLDKNGNRIPILGGARLSGSIGPGTRIGVMSMQTGRSGDYSPENYSAVSVNQNIWGRSVLKGYFLNRQGFLTPEQKQADPTSAWGRNAGISLDLVNKNGVWNGWLAYHHSFKPGFHSDNQYVEGGFSYNGRRFSHMVDLASVGTNYYTDMGYVYRLENYDALRDTTIRVGFKHIFDESTLKFLPLQGKFNRHTLTFDNYLVFNPNNSFNERDHTLKYKGELRDNSLVNLTLILNEINLLFPISFTNSTPLPAANYHYSQATLEYFTDSRKTLAYHILATAGSFYNGNLLTLAGGITFRDRPHLNVALQMEYDRLQFPSPYGSNELFLISPRIDWNFNTALSWTTFLQYNTQQNNFNINSRFQYRFKPMSDIYIVYTDNYFTTPLLQAKNRALVFKLNYWLNL